MRVPSRIRSGSIALLVIAVVVLGAVPGIAAAETRSGGTVVVTEGETVDGLDAFGGTVIVRGTVEGDLSAFAGDVFVEGEVTGDVSAFAGNVRISGDVGGDVSAAAGNVVIESPATIGGSLDASAGNVVIAGAVRGDVSAAGGTVTLDEGATVDGNVEYDVGDEGEFRNRGATVGGTVTRNADLRAGPSGVPNVPGWTFDVYGVLVTLAVGAVLLLAFPGFSERVADRIVEEPLRTGAIGLLALVGVPVVLVLLAITIVGIPLTIVGAVAFAIAVWVAAVYGRFAVGAWLVSLAGVESRWAGLLVGVLAVAVLKLVPVLGGLVEPVVALLGLGAIAALGRETYRRRRGDPAHGRQTTLDETAGG